MQTQRLAPQHRTMLTISICAVLTACAPIPVDDERAQTSAYQRLSTYVSNGQKSQAPKTSSAQQTKAPTAQPAPTPSVASIPSPPKTIATPAPHNTAPVAPTPEPDTARGKSKSLFGVISKFFEDKKPEQPDPSMVPSTHQNWSSTEAESETQATLPNVTQTAPSDQPASAPSHDNPNTSSADSNSLDSNKKPVIYTDADSAPEQEKQSALGGFFSRLKTVFKKDKTETPATTTDNSAANTAAPDVNYTVPVATTSSADAAQVPSASANSHNYNSAGLDTSARNAPSQAFSATNPIYITALDLSINNLSKRLTTNDFALDERSLAFLTKGALDEDSTYKFITEAQLAEQYKASRKNGSSRNLVEAMKDFMPQGGKNKSLDQMPKTMTLFNNVVVLKASNGNGQQAIIMMKLKDNDTGIHLTDTRTTINLSATQTQSSLAINRAIGAELPALLKRLAKNAYESLIYSGLNTNEPDSNDLNNKANQIDTQQRRHQAPSTSTSTSTSTNIIDLSSKALAARTEQDSQHANSVVIDTPSNNRAQPAKSIKTPRDKRVTVKEVLAKKQATKTKPTAKASRYASTPRPAQTAGAVKQTIADSLSKQIANRRAQERKTGAPTQPLAHASPQPDSHEFFGIQLMRATKLDSLKDSLRKLSIDPRKVNIIRQKTQGNRIVFVAIYGQFDSKNEAQQTLDKLPEDVLSEGAFVRRVSAKAPKS